MPSEASRAFGAGTGRGPVLSDGARGKSRNVTVRRFANGTIGLDTPCCRENLAMGLGCAFLGAPARGLAPCAWARVRGLVADGDGGSWEALESGAAGSPPGLELASRGSVGTGSGVSSGPWPGWSSGGSGVCGARAG